MNDRASTARAPATRRHAPSRSPLAVAALALIGAAGSGCLTLLGDYGERGGEDAGVPSSSSSGSGASSSSSGSGSSSSGGGGSGSSSSSSSGAALTCPSGSGPAMVLIPGPEGASDYCIDSTEVTAQQYSDWLAGAADPSKDQPSYCDWNSTHETKTDNDCNGYVLSDVVTSSPDVPVGCVNWCDAFAYCAAAGKRLCGAIGGGPANFASPSNELKSQWFRACSGGGQSVYSYSNQYDPAKCINNESDGVNGYAAGSDHAESAPTPDCVGGYPGVHDMSGNVYEWEDACSDVKDNNDTCYQRGGSFKRSSVGLRCDTVQSTSRSVTNLDSGFRCCAEATPK